MNKLKPVLYLLFSILILSCQPTDDNKKQPVAASAPEEIIVDCNYTFAEAIEGTKAPRSVTEQLELIDVEYYSMDGKIHRGQILTNKKLVADIKTAFEFILKEKFPVEQVIPVVKYNWNDELSMQANNTYSFCYRNVSYSRHAYGMAIDINPLLNPLRWKKEYSYRKDQPANATYNPEIPGTFSPEHPVVLKFKELGFRWGRNFKRNHDDHHFEK